ncbi:MAG TPA: methionyl-tRNA formyltransferase [Chthoniobacterales bacterium]|jgi:methionyl-tRNA formyltransferase
MRVVYMGTGDIGLPALRSLLARPGCEVVAVVTQPDRPAGRGKRLRAPETRIVAEAAGVSVLQPEKMRAPAAVAELAAFAPDVIVVMAYGQILPRSVLDLPRLACLNLHASILPRHRGAAPIQASILAGDAETGVTVMHMAEGLDTGDMLLTRSFPIAPDETGGSLHDRLADLAPEALAAALDLLEAGSAPRFPQDDALATYAGRLTRDDGRIDWTRPAVEIERLVRAMNPWPAASTELPLADGTRAKVKVFAATVLPEVAGDPGVVLSTGTAGVDVATAGGGLRLLEIQGEGGRRMAAVDWLRGHAVVPGGRAG